MTIPKHLLESKIITDEQWKEYQRLEKELLELLKEEKKIPEKLDVIAYDKCIHEVTHKEKQLALEIRETQIALNEIIDYLKSKGE